MNNLAETKEALPESMVIERESFLNYRFEKAQKKFKREEFVRMRLNNQLVTIFSYFNAFILAPVAFFTWLFNLLGFFNLAVLNHIPWWLCIVLWLTHYLTWNYSTITVPIKEGFNIKRDWSKTSKGRKWSLILNIVPFHIFTWAMGTKYVVEYYGPPLTSIRLSERYQGILLTDDLDSLILILFVAPVIASGIGLFLQVRDYMINKDLLEEHFLKWEAPFIRRYAHQYEIESCDVIVGYEIKTKKPIVIKESQRYLHEGIIGATGSGKTSTTLLLRIAQDLTKIATGSRKMGLVFLEPKGDGVDDVLAICKKLGIPDSKIKVIDPTKSWSSKYNPFGGDRDTAAQSFQGTLSALTGDQDAFFKGQQNEAASFYTMLAKIYYGQQTNVLHIQKMFTDPRYLADVAEKVRLIITEGRKNPNLTDFETSELNSFERVVSYFENDVLEYITYTDKDRNPIPSLYPPGHKYAGHQQVKSKKDNFITGAKKYLNEIALNNLLSALFVSNEGDDTFDAEEFLDNGGVLLVNTALGTLEELSILFGQFFIRQFQGAVFRRAKEDKDQDIERIPIFFYIDEFPLFANEAFERFLTLGRSYNVGVIIAMQSIAQLDAISVDYRKAVLGNASNKTVFGRGPVEDNEYFEADFGEELIIEESSNESGSPITSENQMWGFRLNNAKKREPRFTSTFIKELPFKQMLVQVVNEQNSVEVAKHAVGQFVHESPLIKRYMDLLKEEIKSTDEQPFSIASHVDNDTLKSLNSHIAVAAPNDAANNSFESSIIGATPSHSIPPEEAFKNAAFLSGANDNDTVSEEEKILASNVVNIQEERAKRAAMEHEQSNASLDNDTSQTSASNDDSLPGLDNNSIPLNFGDSATLDEEDEKNLAFEESLFGPTSNNTETETSKEPVDVPDDGNDKPVEPRQTEPSVVPPLEQPSSFVIVTGEQTSLFDLVNDQLEPRTDLQETPVKESSEQPNPSTSIAVNPDDNNVKENAFVKVNEAQVDDF